MNNSVTKFLENLSRKRKKLFAALRENKSGILDRLSNIYPDRAHFIFELLQNAEDANATHIRFQLTKDKLIMRHNGRLFNKKDVSSITNIMDIDSEKIDDVDKIGKFGIGFKAIFDYTKTPRIYSGEYNFEILDYICPNEISNIKKDDGETVFIFPFNDDSKKYKDVCFSEINVALKSLDYIVLLFLNNIESIEWNINEEENGYMIRECVDHTDMELIRISKTNPANTIPSSDARFVRFQKPIEKYSNLKCSIAFKMDFIKKNKATIDPQKNLSKQIKIIPVDGQLCVFFPAVKEKTGLKFHLNGPYEATIDRASLKDSQENNEIMKTNARLLIEAMESLKTIGLLTAKFLEILPNSDDNLSSFCEIMKNTTHEALRTRCLIPCLDGGHDKASELVRGRKEITNVIDNAGLAILYEDDNKRWTASVTRSSRSESLLTSLNIPYWGYKELVIAVEKKYSHSRWPYHWHPHQLHPLYKPFNWLRNQSDDWFRSFYLLLFTAIAREERKSNIGSWKIIKTEDGRMFIGSDVYYPVENNSIKSDLPIISSGILDESNKDQRDKIQKFLELAGIQQIGEREEIEQILNRFYDVDSKRPGKKKHAEHMNRFIKWSENENEIEIFRDYLIFLNSKGEYRLGKECYIDNPLEDTRLGVIYSDGKGSNKSRFALWPGYSKIKGIIPFAKSCGVLRSLEAELVDVKNNPRYRDLSPDNPSAKYTPSTGIKIDYSIEHLEEILEDINVDISKLIWDTMSKSPSDVLKAIYKPNNQHDKKYVPSTLVQILQSKKWIPGKDDRFYSPQEMSKDSLRDDFEYNDSNGWLTAIEFSNRKKSKIEIIAKEIGKSIDIDNLPESQENIIKKIENLLAPPAEFPKRSSKNSRNRAARARVRAGKAPEKKYERRERSVRASQPVHEKRIYLEQSYTNNNNQLVCQMCKEEMPFRCRDGRYYFEAVEIFKYPKISREHESAYIALCPLCSAKFIELVREDEQQVQRLWYDIVNFNIEATEKLRIYFQLGEENGSIQFVETHLIDIQQILKDEEKKKPSS